MERLSFQAAVLRGELTPEITTELFIDFTTFINKAFETGKLADVTALAAQLYQLSPDDPEVPRLRNNLQEGLVQGRGLGFFKRQGGHQQLIIHWPTIFALGFENHKSPQSRLTWLFQFLLRRRSPLFFSLLRRKYLTEMGEFEMNDEHPEGKFKDEAFQENLPLNGEEVDLCDNLGRRLLKQPEMWLFASKALLAPLFETGLYTSNNRYDISRYWRRVLGDIDLLLETLVVSRRKLNMVRELLRAGAPLKVPNPSIPHTAYSSMTWGPDMFDVFSLAHLSTPDGRFGVTRVTATQAAIPCLMVNVLVAAKQLSRERKYSKVSEIWRSRPSMLSEAELRDRIALRWGATLPLLVENKLRAYVDPSKVWPLTKPGDVYVVPVAVFDSYRKTSRAMSDMRAKIPAEKRGARRMQAPNFRKIVELRSPGVPEAGGAVFYFRATYRGKALYICPTWEQHFDEEFFATRNYQAVEGEDPVLKSGIVRNIGTGEYYYSLARYLGFKDNPVSLYSSLREWLREFLEGMTHEQFDFMWRSAKQSPMPDVRVPRGAASQPYMEGKFFSPEEDAIIRRLRPGRMDAVLIDLENVHSDKTQKDVSRRATSLRHQLIAEGVYDIDQLPHTNYSAILGKRLKKLKEARLNALNAQA